MAITATNLLTNSSGTDANSYVTASISPTNGKLILLAVSSVSTASPPVNIPSVSGAGMTWTQVATVVETNNNFRRTTVFRGISVGSSGALTIVFSGETQLRCGWSVTEFDNVDISGTNGSNAIVQSATATQNNSSQTGITVTLSDFNNSKNATYGAVRISASGNPITPGSGFTELGESQMDSSDWIQTQFKNTNDTTVDWSWTSAISEATAVAIELKHVGNPASMFMMF